LPMVDLPRTRWAERPAVQGPIDLVSPVIACLAAGVRDAARTEDCCAGDRAVVDDTAAGARGPAPFIACTAYLAQRNAPVRFGGE